MRGFRSRQLWQCVGVAGTSQFLQGIWPFAGIALPEFVQYMSQLYCAEVATEPCLGLGVGK
jgi:hypothetical protein